MIVCPVCEHPQAQGFECEVCGRPLASVREVADAIPALEGLELTQQPGALGAVPIEALPDLERTGNDGASVGAVAAMQDLEPWSDSPAEVVVQSIPELETHRLADPSAGERTAPPTGAVTCRYCRNVQAQGAICDRCGMRLARHPVPAAGAAQAARRDEAPRVRHGCGARTEAGRPCSSCGMFVPLPA
jgi:hypothetical protein